MSAPTRDAVIHGAVRLRSRWMLVRFARNALRSLFYATLLVALVVLVFPALPLSPVVLASALAAALAGLAATALRRPSLAAVAKTYDDSVDLKDRISSSVELLASGGPMVDALFSEAARAAERLEPRRAFPFRVPREGWLLPIPALLVAAAALLPGLLSAGPPESPEVVEAVTSRLGQLEDLISREKAKDPTERRKELVAELEKLHQELSRQKLDKKDAMAELAKMMESLDKAEEQKRQELQDLLRKLQAADRSESIAEQMKEGEYDEAALALDEEIDELKKELEEKRKEGASAEDLEKLEQQLRKMQELQAKLFKLLDLRLDLQGMGEMIDFLTDFEGELADIDEMLEGLQFVDLDCDCDKPGT